MAYSIINGDSLRELKEMKDNSVDSIITDPPYGLSAHRPEVIAKALTEWISGNDTEVPEGKGFMGKDWDSFVPPPALWKECYRVLKPGGHIAVFAGSRTQDLMGLAIRLAGFETRDAMAWLYGSGFPKGQDISKAIDKTLGAKREVIESRTDRRGDGTTYGLGHSGVITSRESATNEAKQWEGWNTALKPSYEPIIVARKPISEKTVAKNVLKWGTGAIDIDGNRVGVSGGGNNCRGGDACSCFDKNEVFGATKHPVSDSTPKGRYPANVALDESAAEALGEPRKFFHVFKYNAKAGKKERPVIERADGSKIQHPTVKPLSLMEHLVKLLTPPGGLVVDPFAGSGSTVQAAHNLGFAVIGIEINEEYEQLIHSRMGENAA